MRTSRRTPKHVQPFDTQIIGALERISLALRVLLWDVAKEKGLSPIQVQFLMYLNSHEIQKRRVSYLARDFGLTQATVSDAVRVLEQKGLVSKKPHEKDRRVTVLSVTGEGRKMVTRLSKWTDILQKQLAGFPRTKKKTVTLFLMDLVKSLQSAGIVKTARMCIVCGNFHQNVFANSKKPHQCDLTGRRIGPADLRIDCETHTAAAWLR
jgi:DNA-binding MarR family transcriptional regulator